MANGVRARKELIIGVRVSDRGVPAPKLVLLDQRSPFIPCEAQLASAKRPLPSCPKLQ
jgi:hypothetical protein